MKNMKDECIDEKEGTICIYTARKENKQTKNHIRDGPMNFECAIECINECYGWIE
jgi:hypothetical protein